MARRHVVGDTVGPGSQRGVPTEGRERAPNVEEDLLLELEAPIFDAQVGYLALDLRVAVVKNASTTS